LPVPHGGHEAPPQSTSVSVLSRTEFVQVATLHRPWEQMPPEQSVPAVHALPIPQALHEAPPQSTSVSSP
jgi:hypothetical protein